MRITSAICFIFLALCASSATPAHAEPTVSMSQGYVSAVPPESRMTAAYFTLHNRGKRAVKLIAVESPVAKAVEMHTHTHQNGLMKMEKIDFIEVAPGREARLEPMGNHVMFIGLKKELGLKDRIPLTLRFSDGQKLELNLPVKAD